MTPSPGAITAPELDEWPKLPLQQTLSSVRLYWDTQIIFFCHQKVEFYKSHSSQFNKENQSLSQPVCASAS